MLTKRIGDAESARTAQYVRSDAPAGRARSSSPCWPRSPRPRARASVTLWALPRARRRRAAVRLHGLRDASRPRSPPRTAAAAPPAARSGSASCTRTRRGGHVASLRFATPAGVTVDRVWLGRRVDGPGLLGAHLDDAARVARRSRARSTASSTRRPAASGSSSGCRCDERPGDALRRDGHGRRLPLRGPDRPRRGQARVHASAASRTSRRERSTLVVDAQRHRARAGERRARRSAGAPAAAVKLGQSFCGELSPGDAHDRPAARRGLPGVGPRDAGRRHHGGRRRDAAARAHRHRRRRATRPSAASTCKVLNHPPVATPTPDADARRRASRSPSRPTPTPDTASPNVGVLRGPQAATRSRARARFKVDASCPAAAPASCTLSLKLSARLPGPQEGRDDRERPQDGEARARARRSRSSSPRRAQGAREEAQAERGADAGRRGAGDRAAQRRT